MSPRIKKSQSVKISLISPDEAKTLIEKERQRRRLIRLHQVREEDKIRSQIGGQIIREMTNELMKAVAENIAENVRKSYRIEVEPVASTSNDDNLQTSRFQIRQNVPTNSSESKRIKHSSTNRKTPLKRLKITSTIKSPTIRKNSTSALKHRRCSACNPNNT